MSEANKTIGSLNGRSTLCCKNKKTNHGMKHARTKQKKYDRDIEIFGINSQKKSRKLKHCPTKMHFHQSDKKKSGKPSTECFTQVKQE